MKKSRKCKVLLVVTLVLLMLIPGSAVLAAGKPCFSEESVNLAVGKTHDLKVFVTIKLYAIFIRVEAHCKFIAIKIIQISILSNTGYNNPLFLRYDKRF
jgi:hypothetical protein